MDFSSFPATRPFSVGTALPPSCGLGQIYFLSSATAGTNIFGCVATNTWALQSGNTGPVTARNTGQDVGSRPIVDFYSGPGILLAMSDTGQEISVQANLDTAFVQTRRGEQSGAALFCASTSDVSGTIHSCSMSPTLTAYTAGMVLHWKPDAVGSGGPATLNIDLLGSVPVKLADGVTDVGSTDLVAGRLQDIWYDGSVFRLSKTNLTPGITGESQPVCTANLRGRFWFAPRSSGSKDELSVCAKDTADNYAWRAIY